MRNCFFNIRVRFISTVLCLWLASNIVFALEIGNVGGYDTHSVQLGVGNFQGENSSGAQIGVVEYCDKYKGFQMGVLNISSDSSSDLLQIGLINYCSNGFIPFFPLFNFSVFEGRENVYPRAINYAWDPTEED